MSYRIISVLKFRNLKEFTFFAIPIVKHILRIGVR